MRVFDPFGPTREKIIVFLLDIVLFIALEKMKKITNCTCSDSYPKSFSSNVEYNKT